MPTWTMAIDLDKCVGCQACTIACRMENNTPVAGPEQAALGRAAYWNMVLPFPEGEYPNVKARYIPRPCMHCADPACVKVCPTKATYQTDEGIVLIDYERCIGCRFCTVGCPYAVRCFNWYEPTWPAELKVRLNPDPETAPRPRASWRSAPFACSGCDGRASRPRPKAASFWPATISRPASRPARDGPATLATWMTRQAW